MNCIYCYTNKINGHKYVGQTNDIKRRDREHKSQAFNKNSSSYNSLFDKKIREYGWENFDLEILEEIEKDNQDYINEREIYWIKEKNSYCLYGKGYNLTLGGNNVKKIKILSDEEVIEIKELIKKGISYNDIKNKFNISITYISNINTGIYYYDENEKYPLYKYYKSNEDYKELIDLLLNSNLSLFKISEKLNIGYSTVKKINSGKLRPDLYNDYPIRRKSPNEIQSREIQKDLYENILSLNDIVKKYNISKEKLRRINIGENWYNEDYKYPIRQHLSRPFRVKRK